MLKLGDLELLYTELTNSFAPLAISSDRTAVDADKSDRAKIIASNLQSICLIISGHRLNIQLHFSAIEL
jgi:hypothetical protein